jgi:hypothetical protein
VGQGGSRVAGRQLTVRVEAWLWLEEQRSTGMRSPEAFKTAAGAATQAGEGREGQRCQGKRKGAKEGVSRVEG